MKKFLLGILAGLIIAGVTGVVLLFAAVKFSQRPPQAPEKAYLTLRLEGDLPEAAPLTFPLPAFESRSPMTTAEVWSVLRRAAVDPRIKGIVLKPRGLQAGWGKAEEIRTGIEKVRKAGKPVYAYLTSPGVKEYYVASAADRIYVSPEDVLDVKGLRLQAMYFKGSLDKLGVKMEVEHAGKYKDAGDMFTRTSMSEESKEALNPILDELFGRLCSAIAAGRKLPVERVRALVDEGPFLAPKAKAAGLVDGLEYERAVERQLAEKAGLELGQSIAARDFLRASGDPSGGKAKSVAYLVAQGDILRGGVSGLMGEEQTITPHAMERQMRLIAKDPSIRGVILRVDSPGGDAIASDEILAELKKLSKSKPVVISMSDVAASGGYYISMTGDPVIAYPGTLTGSIGVVYGKPNLGGLYDKLGISTEELKRGRFSDLDSETKPLSAEGRAKLRESIDFIYRGFVGKVAEGRRKKPEQVEPLAQGRVWIGAHAKANGLVDELGGLDKAVELVKFKAALGTDESVRLVVFPQRRTLIDELLRPAPGEDAGSPGVRSLSQASLLMRGLPRGVAPWVSGGMLRVMPYSIDVE